jgi:hypothetical protein
MRLSMKNVARTMGKMSRPPMWGRSGFSKKMLKRGVFTRSPMGVKVFGDFGDFAAFGEDNWLTSLVGVAREVIPAHTVVGRAIGSTRVTAPRATPVAIEPVAPSAFGGMPSWAMPVAIGGGALLLVMMLKNKSGSRRRRR